MGMFKREKKISDTIVRYHKVFGTEDGELVLHDMMKSCHMMEPSFDPNPYETAFNEGARSVVLRILRTIKTDPDALLRMVEQGNRKETGYVD